MTKDDPQPLARHLLIELHGATCPATPKAVKAALAEAARACGARVLSIHAHRFKPHGLTAVALLAESHITVHSWPEHGYAAADVFLCGDTDPFGAVPVLAQAYAAGRVETRLVSRGEVPASPAPA